jgi:metal-responsive CopG/Arc/MetJ family transcriptional regulator
MKEATTRDNTKTPRPRPKETGTLIGVRLQADALSNLDTWIAKQNDAPSRPEAVRRLLDKALPEASGRQTAKKVKE